VIGNKSVILVAGFGYGRGQSNGKLKAKPLVNYDILDDEQFWNNQWVVFNH
jgi:hypothetical protein